MSMCHCCLIYSVHCICWKQAMSKCMQICKFLIISLWFQCKLSRGYPAFLPHPTLNWISRERWMDGWNMGIEPFSVAFWLDLGLMWFGLAKSLGLNWNASFPTNNFKHAKSFTFFFFITRVTLHYTHPLQPTHPNICSWKGGTSFICHFLHNCKRSPVSLLHIHCAMT